jgi:hypothetical protein
MGKCQLNSLSPLFRENKTCKRKGKWKIKSGKLFSTTEQVLCVSLLAIDCVKWHATFANLQFELIRPL